jgi:hypothetical protein
MTNYTVSAFIRGSQYTHCISAAHAINALNQFASRVDGITAADVVSVYLRGSAEPRHYRKGAAFGTWNEEQP